MTELNSREIKEILIACIDGLKGFTNAIASVYYPKTDIQLCIVHMIRNSLRFVSWKNFKLVTKDLKEIYQARTEENALNALFFIYLEKYTVLAIIKSVSVTVLVTNSPRRWLLSLTRCKSHWTCLV